MSIAFYLYLFCHVFFFSMSFNESIQYPGFISSLSLLCISSQQNFPQYPCEVRTNDQTHLSINILVIQVKSQNARNFRAHPLLISCLQNISSSLLSQIDIMQFYLAEGEDLVFPTNDSYLNLQLRAHHMAGLAVTFSFPNATTDWLLAPIIRLCWDSFSDNQFAIGIVALNQSLLVLLLMPNQTLFYPKVLEATFYKLLDEYLNPTLPNCSIENIPENSSFPIWTNNPEVVVGAVSTPIIRNSLQFLSLIQNPASNISFTGCTQFITGASVDSRCASRVMSLRMYRMLKVLSSFVGRQTFATLRVVRSWAEDPLNISYFPCLSNFNITLFSEGRAMLLEAGKNLSLSRLAGLARCSGFDYVYYGCGHLLVAVKNQSITPPFSVVFPRTVLFPISNREVHSSIFNNTDLFPFYSPLFDSSLVQDQILSKGILVLHIAGPQRYFRIHPVLVGCLQLMEDNLKTNFKNASLNIMHAYSTNSEQVGKSKNMRTGLAIEINLTSQNCTQQNLILLIINSCASYVFLQNTPFREMQFGLYSNSLYFAIAGVFRAWNETNFFVPNFSTFSNWVARHYYAAIKGYLIKSELFSISCSVTLLQNYSEFKYSSPYYIYGVKFFLSPPNPKNCPVRHSRFCKKSIGDREELFSDILFVLMRKYIPKDVNLKEDLFNCLIRCTTCTEGVIWRIKLASCHNLVYLASLTQNHALHNTNYYVSGNSYTEKMACDGSRFCLKESPLYAVIAVPFLWYSFRSNIHKSFRTNLSTIAENPNPIIYLLNVFFAMFGVGNATLWITDSYELHQLNNVLQILLFYTQNIDYVNILLLNSKQYFDVRSHLEALIKDWNNNGCHTINHKILNSYKISVDERNIRRMRIDRPIIGNSQIEKP